MARRGAAHGELHLRARLPRRRRRHSGIRRGRDSRKPGRGSRAAAGRPEAPSVIAFWRSTGWQARAAMLMLLVLALGAIIVPALASASPTAIGDALALRLLP